MKNINWEAIGNILVLIALLGIATVINLGLKDITGAINGLKTDQAKVEQLGVVQSNIVNFLEESIKANQEVTEVIE